MEDAFKYLVPEGKCKSNLNITIASFVKLYFPLVALLYLTNQGARYKFLLE